jgi:RimK-like ATP-grasp domain
MSLPLIPTWQARRRLIGWVRRKTQWEFWPPWVAYIPLIPYFLYLGLKYRSLTLFTAANPGIPSGGFVGESKCRILANLGHVPTFTLIPSSLSADARFEAAKRFLALYELHYPVVLKPNIGERGSRVALARNEPELRSYLYTASKDTIIQKYVDGLEFGIFYYRHPHDARGQIFSITEKQFPEVCGDGKRTVLELVLKDERAVCLANAYLAQLRCPANRVPAAGETIRLAELGSHCRGAVFLNGACLETDALRSAVDCAAKCHPGFFFGRFDVRTPSIGDLQAGRFEILELNGVSAEPTHIYDPSVTLFDAYRVLFQQWRLAFAIGAANRKGGVRPMSLRDFLHLLRTRYGHGNDSPGRSASKSLLPLEYLAEKTGY